MMLLAVFAVANANPKWMAISSQGDIATQTACCRVLHKVGSNLVCAFVKDHASAAELLQKKRSTTSRGIEISAEN